VKYEEKKNNLDPLPESEEQEIKNPKI